MKRLVVSLAFSLLLPSFGCGDPTSDLPVGDALPQHAFDDEACQVLEGSARTEPRAAAEGVASITYSSERDGLLVTLDALAPDDTLLGTASIRYDVELGSQPRWTTAVEYAEGGVIARQTTVAVPVGAAVRHTTVHEIDDAKSYVWWTMTPAGELLSMTAGAPTTADPDPAAGILRLPEGVFRTLKLVEDGAFLPSDEEVSAFMATAGLQPFEDSVVYRRLGAVVDDGGWQAQLGPRALACVSQTAASVEAELGLGTNTTSSALTCEKGSPFKDVLTIEGVLGTVTTAAGLTLTLGAIGLVTTGAGAAVLFVGTVIALHAAGKVIDWIVSERFSNIVAAPAIHAGDEEGAAAVMEFYGKKGSTSGDPHLVTHDGEAFDLQSAGELVLVRGTSSSFEVQVRQGPRPASACPNVSLNDAVAVHLGAHRVTFDPARDRPLYVDGTDVDLLDGVLLLDDGGQILGAGRMLQLVAPTGESVVLTGVSALNVYVDLPSERAGAYEGLLGNFDGVLGNDLIGENDTVLTTPVAWEKLHGTFAARWAVDDDSTLFDYEGTEGPADFLVDGFPSGPANLDQLDPAARLDAEAACASVENETAFTDCVLDVACTGDASWADVHAVRDPYRRTEVLVPLTFEGWTQEGPVANGTWVVADDQGSVLQTTNGQPTFFISPDDYLGVRIDGTIKAGASDDDFVGFVFGYKTPVAANGDVETAIDTFVVTWKKAAQLLAPEGVRLLHVHGDLDTAGATPLFWDVTATDSVEILGEDVGPGTGWRIRPTRFSLLYTEDRIEVWLDGELRIALDAAGSAHPFDPGRFGFFNFSQANTLYSDFTVAPPIAAPQRADCTMVFDHAEANYITEDTTLGRSCTRYEIESRILQVQEGTLTILPGTTILFDEGLRFEVQEGGAVVAEGTTGEPIHIGGREPITGYWGGLSIGSDSPQSTLKHVVLSDTGASGWQFNDWGLTLTGTGTVLSSTAVEDCTFLRHGGHAMHVLAGADLRSFARNTFDDCDDLPLFLPSSMLHKVDAASSFSGAGNPLPFVGVSPLRGDEVMSGPLTWRKLDVPYRFLAGVHAIEGTDTVVTIEPGTRLEFEPLGALDAAEGALTAIGTADAPIVFTGLEETPGAWRGLYFQQALDENVLDHVELRYAGADGFEFQNTAIMVTGDGTTPGKLTLRNSVVSDSFGAAVTVRQGGTFLEENNTYSNNAGGDVVTP